MKSLPPQSAGRRSSTENYHVRLQIPDHVERSLARVILPFDGELSNERSHELLAAIRRDAGACEDLARTRIGIERLRGPVEMPDLSEAILTRVHGRRRFLPRRARRLVTAGRFAVAAGVVGAVALGSFVQRQVPEVRLGHGAAPVSRIVEATGQTAVSQPHLAAQTVETIQASLASPMGALSLGPRLRPEAEIHFDLALERGPGVVTASYTLERVPIVVGAPMASDWPTAQTESPLISRFGSLLIVLREPQPILGDEPSADD